MDICNVVIRSMAYGDRLWESLENYADNRSWRSGKLLAKQMKAHAFEN